MVIITLLIALIINKAEKFKDFVTEKIVLIRFSPTQ